MIGSHAVSVNGRMQESSAAEAVKRIDSDKNLDNYLQEIMEENWNLIDCEDRKSFKTRSEIMIKRDTGVNKCGDRIDLISKDNTNIFFSMQSK